MLEPLTVMPMAIPRRLRANQMAVNAITGTLTPPLPTPVRVRASSAPA